MTISSWLRSRLLSSTSGAKVGMCAGKRKERHRSVPRLEALENRIVPTVPMVLSINRAEPLGPWTGSSSVAYTVTFNEPVTGVAPVDFRVAADQSLQASPNVVVTGSGANYTVAVNDIRGNGNLRLDLIDFDSIKDSAKTPLGGVGKYNESFEGQTYFIAQASPYVTSLTLGTPASALTNANNVIFTATFSEPVVGVNPTDFKVVRGGTVVDASVQVTPVNTAVYAITVSGIIGSGTLGLNLVNNGSIHDLAGNALIPPGAPASFGSQATLAAGTNPGSVAVADLNGDGKLDLVVANYGSNNVSVLLGNGNGTFRAQATYATGKGPDHVQAVDLNGDGITDLVVSNFLDNSVSILLGNGNGTFQSQTSFATGNSPYSLAVADLNGDGRPDLVVANYGSNDVGVFLGNGNGTFKNETTLGTGANSNPYSVTVADVNGDARPDIVVANEGGNNVGMYLGNGDGSFQSETTFATGAGTSPDSVAVSDMNGDGKPDLVVADFATSNVSLLLGNGDGTFQSPTTFATGSFPSAVAVTDINGDGRPDLVTSNYVGNSLSVLLGNGDGTFQAQSSLATGVEPQGFAVADLNGDGRPDLVVPNSAGNDLSVMLASGNGNFTGPAYTIDHVAPQVVSIDGTSPANPITNANAVVYTATFSKPVVGVDAGDFQLALTGTLAGTVSKVTPVSTSVYTVTVTGITGNGSLGLNVGENSGIHDLAGNALNSGFTGQGYTVDHVPPIVVAIQRNTPTASSTSAVSVSYAVAFSEAVTGVSPSSFHVTLDQGLAATSQVLVSGNGSAYTITINGIHGTGSLRLDLVDNDSIKDLAGNPLGGPGKYNGSFQGQTYAVDQSYPYVVSINRQTPGAQISNAASVSFTVTFSKPVVGVAGTSFNVVHGGTVTVGSTSVTAVSGSVYTVTLSGITGSGSLGVNLVDNGKIRDLAGNPLAQSNGSPTFTSQTTIATGSQPTWVAVADLNGDGKPDLIVANYGSNSLSVLLGNGNGAFQNQITYATGMNPVSAVLTDVNGDGKPDLIVTNSGSNSLSVLLGNGNGTFQNQLTFATGSNPWSLAIADVNGDGKPDLVVTDEGGNSVSVLLSNGNGTFQNQVIYSAGTNPYGVTVSDLNGDGKPDLVVVNGGSNNVSVLLGNGDGTFQSQATIATSAGSYYASVADINGDGVPDIVVDSFANDSVGALLGNGDGTFQNPLTFATATNPVGVTIADLSSDRRPDLLVCNDGSNTVSLLQGNGDGTFGSASNLAVGINPTFVAVADLNGDTRPDLVVCNQTYGSANGSVSVLLQNSRGSFAGQTYTIDHTAPYVKSLDGTTPSSPITNASTVAYTVTFSEAVTGVTPGDFQLVLGTSLAATLSPQVTAISGSVYQVTVSNISGNGTLGLNLVNNGQIQDLAGNPLSAGFTGQVYTIDHVPPVLQSLAATNPTNLVTSASSVTYTATFSEPVTGVVAADFQISLSGTVKTTAFQVSATSAAVYTVTVNGITGSGTLGLSLVNNGSIHDLAGNPLALSVNSAADFAAQTTLAVGNNPVFVTTADVNGDGKPDLVVANSGSGTISILLGNGNGTFQAQTTLATGAGPRVVAVADLNGDGKLDLIVADAGTLKNGLYSGHDVGVLLGNGNGTFQSEVTYATMGGPVDLTVADLNGDGKPDLVVSNWNSASVSVLLGNGDGTFAPQETFAVGINPAVVAIADVNGDSKPDILTLNTQAGTVSVLLGNGDGTFKSQSTIAAGTAPTGLAVADLNGDGKSDLVVTSPTADTVSILLGNGDGTFQPPTTFAAGGQPAAVVTADLNGDGHADLVLADANQSTVSVLVGNGDGTFQQAHTFATGSSPASVAIADLNGDGLPDLVTANFKGHLASVLLGELSFPGAAVYTIQPSAPDAPVHANGGGLRASAPMPTGAATSEQFQLATVNPLPGAAPAEKNDESSVMSSTALLALFTDWQSLPAYQAEASFQDSADDLTAIHLAKPHDTDDVFAASDPNGSGWKMA